MSRRAGLWALGLTSVVVFVVMAAIDRELRDKGGDGMIDLQFAGSTERAEEITEAWGEDGREDARLQLGVDFGYLLLYGAFLYLAARAVGDGAAARGWTGLSNAARLAAPAALAAATFDALENVLLLIVLDGPVDGSPAALLATTAASIKWLLAIIVIAVTATGAVRLRRAG